MNQRRMNIIYKIKKQKEEKIPFCKSNENALAPSAGSIEYTNVYVSKE